MKKVLFQKVIFTSIAGYIALHLTHWSFTYHHIMFARLIENLMSLIINHVDVSVLSAIETFMLANVTAFIAVYDFTDKIRKKKRNKTMPKPKPLKRKRTSPRHSTQSGRKKNGR